MSEKNYTVLQPFTCGAWSYRAGDTLKVSDFDVRGFSDTDLARHMQRGEIEESQVVEARRKIERIFAVTQQPSPPAAEPKPNS